MDASDTANAAKIYRQRANRAMIRSWSDIIMMMKVAPAAVCRQLLTHLETHKPLTKGEEARILLALKNSGVPDASERVLATLSRNTVQEILEQI